MINASSINGPLIILSAGGSGGHVFPAEALAKELGKRGCRLVLVTDRRGDNWGDRLSTIETYRVSAGAMVGKGITTKIFNAGEIGIGILQSRRLLGRIKPDVVVGFGGYASIPMMIAASYSSVATAIHEQNALLGRANRLLAQKVRKIATSYKNVFSIPGRAQPNVICTGMPVREQVEVLRDVPYPKFDQQKKIELLVFGGSQGASIFSRILPEAMGLLDEKLRSRINLVHQCRSEDFSQLQSTYNQIGMKVEVSTFFDDLPDRIAKSQLVISRAGASTVAELTIIGRPAILVPYPHSIDDHQSKNAYTMAEAGGGWLMPNEAFGSQNLSHRLQTLLAMPKTLENAAHASRQIGQTNATQRLADMVIDLIPKDNSQLNTGNVT